MRLQEKLVNQMIQFKNVSKQFSVHFVLQNFSFEIQKAEKINITGRSGIGKTTIFKLLLGFVKPDKGEILFKGEVLNDKTIWDFRKRIVYISQDLNIGSGKVYQLFEETLSLKANAELKTESLKSLNELLIQFELNETILNKDIEDLSGGEKQRIAIINGLLLNRDIFLLDEITSALDKTLKQKVIDFFYLHPNFTVLSISHDNYIPENSTIRTLKLD